MEVGEKFDIDGYVVSAKIGYNSDMGEVLVVHNESSHFLVATRDIRDGEPDPLSTFVESFRYDAGHKSAEDDDEVTFQYGRALRKAVQIALQR